ncbi:hypothetical protein VVAX_02458 [Variovorax paradoxus]|uniref:Uncharacterized protein n=1 Tax=Variovorax paradoxus TaxID=34073 RepID=A0A679IY06_VARPD|nr:hypothetical protein VVAX_02458 [Variovorax paradoxus]
MSQRFSARAVLGGSALLLVAAIVLGAVSGAYAISLSQLWNVLTTLGQGADKSPEHLVFLNIRLPRLLLGWRPGQGWAWRAR